MWERTQYCARFFPGAASLRCSLPTVPAPFALGCDGDSQGLTAVWPSWVTNERRLLHPVPVCSPCPPVPQRRAPTSCFLSADLPALAFHVSGLTRCGPFLTGSHGALCVQGSPVLQQVSVLHALLGPRSRVDGPSCIHLWMNSWVVSTASACDGSCRGHSCTSTCWSICSDPFACAPSVELTLYTLVPVALPPKVLMPSRAACVPLA